MLREVCSVIRPTEKVIRLVYWDNLRWFSACVFTVNGRFKQYDNLSWATIDRIIAMAKGGLR